MRGVTSKPQTSPRGQTQSCEHRAALVSPAPHPPGSCDPTVSSVTPIMPNLKSPCVIYCNWWWGKPTWQYALGRSLGGKDSLRGGQNLIWSCKPLLHNQSGSEASAAWPHLKSSFRQPTHESHGLRKVLCTLRFHMELMTSAPSDWDWAKSFPSSLKLSADIDPS